MNSDVFEKHNGYAPFDDLLLFPFFNSYPKANQLISVLIGKEVKIESIRIVDLDVFAGKMANGLEICAKGNECRYCIFLARLSKMYGESTIKCILSYCSFCLEERWKEGLLPYSVFITDMAEEPSVLIRRKDIELEKKDFKINASFINENCKASGTLSDIIMELCNGERGKERNQGIRYTLKWVISEEGREAFSSYWNQMDRRWRVNLYQELMDSGVEEQVIKKTLDLDDEDMEKARVNNAYRNFILSFFKYSRRS